MVDCMNNIPTAKQSLCKHKFQPRYDEVENQRRFEVNNMFADDIRKLIIRRVYVHDICVRCGMIVGRDE
jgi:hypothetical protein